MNQIQSLPPETWLLVDELLNGRLSKEQAAKLEESLRDNPKALEQFAHYCQLHIDLTIDHRADHAGRLFREQQTAAECGDLPETVNELRPLVPRPALVRTQRYLALAASMLVGVALVAVILNVGSNDLVAPRGGGARAEITAVGSQQVARTFPAVVKLDAGSSTTLELEDVGHIHLQGPADFQFLGPMRARLNSGRIRMRVTKESGRGYVVETPDGDITDLGTEFGVNVMSGSKSALAVFEGAVDLLVADQKAEVPHVERLIGGDGVLFNRGGQLDRLNSILTGPGARFEICGDTSQVSFDDPLITDVYDNLPSKSTKRYYEIAARGLNEDSRAYVDRLCHNWNGIASKIGMPKYLRSADYVKTFCEDKHIAKKDFALTVVLSRPAKLYIIYDRRLSVPSWLADTFYKTEDTLGMDVGRDDPPSDSTKSMELVGNGAGQSIDLEFSIWERKVDKPGPVVLGPMGNYHFHDQRAMYGIAAVDLPEEKEQRTNKSRPAKVSTALKASQPLPSSGVVNGGAH